MTGTLNITNGDAAGNGLSASGLPGEVLPWRDTMHQGPFPAGHDLDAVSLLRAEFLAGGALPVDDIRADFRNRNDRLRRSSADAEVILWFEHDLLDQVQIPQILDWYANPANRPDRLAMICIDSFPGIEPFHGIGQLQPHQLAGLAPGRVEVTEEQLTLARHAWQVFRQDDPRTLTALLSEDLSALPFLAAALRRHCEEYPESRTGLTRTERQLLGVIGGDGAGPGPLFRGNMVQEDALHMGDWQVFDRVARLISAPEPLVRVEGTEEFRYPPLHDLPLDDFLAQRLHLTPAGERALSGERIPGFAGARDEWLGGVHLTGSRPCWSYDAAEARFRKVDFREA
jgi:hypothetical protein